jgi:hypothetical protein
MPRPRGGRHLRSRQHLEAAARAASHARHSRRHPATHVSRRSPARAALALVGALSLVGVLSLLHGATAGRATFSFLPSADADVASTWATSAEDASGPTSQFQGWLVASSSKSYSFSSGSGTITVTVDCGGRAKVKVALINPRGYTETAYTRACSRGPIDVSKTVSAAGTYTVKLTELAGFSTSYTATVLHPAMTASTPTTSTTTAAVATTSTTQAPTIGTTTTTPNSNTTTTTYAASSGKIWLALYLQYIDAGSQFNIYNPNTDGGDVTRLRANGNSNGLCDTGMKSDYVTKAQALPGAAGTAYKCSRGIVENAQRDRNAGFSITEFNFETGFNITEDNNDPVAAIKRASDAAHAAGLQLRCTPDRQLTKNLAAQFAPYCDHYHIQAQALQPDGVGAYSAFVHDIVAKLKAANPRLQRKITVQVSPGRGAPAGKDVQQHMRDCVDSVMDVADGASMWFGGNELDQLRSFVAWFDMKYG